MLSVDAHIFSAAFNASRALTHTCGGSCGGWWGSPLPSLRDSPGGMSVPRAWTGVPCGSLGVEVLADGPALPLVTWNTRTAHVSCGEVTCLLCTLGVLPERWSMSSMLLMHEFWCSARGLVHCQAGLALWWQPCHVSFHLAPDHATPPCCYCMSYLSVVRQPLAMQAYTRSYFEEYGCSLLCLSLTPRPD